MCEYVVWVGGCVEPDSHVNLVCKSYIRLINGVTILMYMCSNFSCGAETVTIGRRKRMYRCCALYAMYNPCKLLTFSSIFFIRCYLVEMHFSNQIQKPQLSLSGKTNSGG